MKSLRPTCSEAIILLLTGAFALALIICPPMIGLADNGDFHRLMHWGKFEYLSLEQHDQFFNWINREYRITLHPLRARRGFVSSEAIFVKASALLSAILLPNRHFDIRLLGILHVLGFITGFWMLLKGWQARFGPKYLLLVPGFLLIFCDIGYLAYFHSFYSEPASIIFLLAMVGLGLLIVANENYSLWLLVLFFLAALLFLTAKPQNLPFVLPLLLFNTYLGYAIPALSRRAVVVLASILLVITTIATYLFIPPAMKQANLYNSTFNGILRNSPSPQQDLTSLGLSKEFAALAGTTYFDSETAIDIRGEGFRAGFYQRTNALKIIVFYLTHPRRYIEKLEKTSQHAYTLQTGLGNFEKRSGEPASAKAKRWTYWSRFKQNYMPKSIWFCISFLALLLILVVGNWWRRRESIFFFYFVLWLMMVISLLTPIPGDGENDLGKHLFLFNAFFDLSLLLLAGHFIHAISKYLDARRTS